METVGITYLFDITENLVKQSILISENSARSASQKPLRTYYTSPRRTKPAMSTTDGTAESDYESCPTTNEHAK